MKRTVKRVYDENGNVTHKVCSSCKELKSVEEFNVKKASPDGHVSKCKKCKKEYDKQYLEENREQKKQYYGEHKEQIKEQKKQYYEEHKEQIKEQRKQYYEENKEQVKERRKQHYKENKEQVKERNKQYREENKEQIKKQRKQYRKENKEQIKEYKKQHYEDLCDETITRIKAIVEQDPTRYDYRDGEEIYGIIYLVYCKITNKYYVGQTTIGFDNRYSKGFFNDKDHKTKEDLMEDLKKYGEDSFEFTEIFRVAHNKEELDNLEVYYIDHFDSYYNGYNRTRGNHRD